LPEEDEESNTSFDEAELKNDDGKYTIFASEANESGFKSVDFNLSPEEDQLEKNFSKLGSINKI